MKKKKNTQNHQKVPFRCPWPIRRMGRALFTVNHCSSCTSYVGVAQKRTHSGAGQCEVCKSSTVTDKAMVHNGITVYFCGVRNTNPTCFKYMLAKVKNLLRHWRNG